MKYWKRTAQATIIIGSLAVIATIGINLWSYNVYSQIDSMSRDLNDAEKPEKAFQFFNTYLNNTSTNPWKRYERRSLSGNLPSRLSLSSKGLMDLAISSGTFAGGFLGDATRINYTAAYTAHCPYRYLEGEMCETRKNNPFYTQRAAEWFMLAQDAGGLKAFWNNETATRWTSNYFKRSEYYDARLRKGGFEMKPVEMAFYTENGLFLVGTRNNNITIDSDTIQIQDKGRLMYADVKLEKGEHSVKAGKQKFNLKVRPSPHDKGISTEEGFALTEHDEYEKVVLKGSKGTKTAELEENGTTTVEIPSEKYTDEENPNYTNYKPFNVTLVSHEINTTYTYGTPDTKKVRYGIRPYAFGMTPKQYSKARTKLNEIENITSPIN